MVLVLFCAKLKQRETRMLKIKFPVERQGCTIS